MGWTRRPRKRLFEVVDLSPGSGQPQRYFSNSITAVASERRTSVWLESIVSKSDYPHRSGHHEPAGFRYPWIVSVEYSWTIGNAGSEWGTRYYLSLFGMPILLGEDVDMVS